MQRRQAISVLLGALAQVDAKASGSLDRFSRLDPGRGCFGRCSQPPADRRRWSRHRGEITHTTRFNAKPLVVAALLRSGKLSAEASFPCPRRLRIGNRTLDCSHPLLAVPMRIDSALAYSCNCFVAHAAEQFGPGELAQELAGSGLASRTSWFGNEEAVGTIRPGVGPNAQRVQALGEDGILVTTAELAAAYRLLALKINSPEMQPILAGLEGAVEFGTAQNVRVSAATSGGTPGGKLAGKTGSVLSAAGEPVAWFAGFWPSRAPETVVTVMVPGHSGGADAAPIAGRILEAYRAGRL